MSVVVDEIRTVSGDMKQSEIVEKKIRDVIKAHPNCDAWHNTELPDYVPGKPYRDLDVRASIEGKIIDVEIKDESKQAYENVCVEDRCNYAPSGIETSKADVWVHTFSGNRAVVYSADEMKEYIKEGERGGCKYDPHFAGSFPSPASGWLVGIGRAVATANMHNLPGRVGKYKPGWIVETTIDQIPNVLKKFKKT